MLRRPPTTLTLTSEDIAIYEDKRSREAAQQQQRSRTTQQPAYRYDHEELLAASQSPYAHLPPTHPKRRTILDPPGQRSGPSRTGRAGGGWSGAVDAASEQDLRNFAAAQPPQRHQRQHQRPHRDQPPAQAQVQRSAAVHFTPVTRGNSIPPTPNGPLGDDSDLMPAAGLSSPPEASALLQSSSDRNSSSSDEQDGGAEEEDDDDDEEEEDEEMADYDAIQALPRSARLAGNGSQQHYPQQHYQAANLHTPVNNLAAAQMPQQQQQQHTPVPTAAVSHIPQAPQRRGHARVTSGRGGPGGVGGRGAEPQLPPPPPPPRMTRSREERLGAAAATGTRRTGR